jgi:hypothetical protein
MLILRSVGSKEAILAQNGDGSIEVIGNDPTMLQAAIGSPTNRRGSFEIVCFKDGQEKFQVLFSKLEKGAFRTTMRWPERLRPFTPAVR